MAELDIVQLKNPTSEDFTVYYNGEPYILQAGEKKSFTKHVGYHIAKHLAHQIVDASISIKDKNDPKKSTGLAKLSVYDNPKLRIALFTILNDVHEVEQTILAFPYKGFIGDMDEYKKFVTDYDKPKTSSKK